MLCLHVYQNPEPVDLVVGPQYHTNRVQVLSDTCTSTMHIFVSGHGRSLALRVASSDAIGAVVDRIELAAGLSRDHGLRLTFAGKELVDDGRCLSDFQACTTSPILAWGAMASNRR